MNVNTYHINHFIKSYFKQNRSINQGRRKVQPTFSDTVMLSTAGRKRLFEKMKEHAIDQVKIYHKEK